MQSDGNFVLYGANYVPVYFVTSTQGNPGAWMVIQDDGNLVIYNQDGAVALWNTRTAGE
jgi:hypothetical protein